MNKNNRGFSLIEITAVIVIIGIIMSVFSWKIISAKSHTKDYLAVEKACVVNIAKQTFYNEFGDLAITQYQSNNTDGSRFDLIKRYLPYTEEHLTLERFMPKGYLLQMNNIASKTTVVRQSDNSIIHY